MEPGTGEEGVVGERRRTRLPARNGADVERVGAFAAQVLEDLYGLVYGEPPVGVRAWCDGSALLMVVRLAGPSDGSPADLGAMMPCEGIPELVTAAVRAQTGWELAVGSWSVETDLGLVMFVFRLPDDPPQRPRMPEAGAPHATRGELEARRAVRWHETHVPSWRAWSPVPGEPLGGGEGESTGGAPERRRLRVVED
jgi:hypothetical protein